MKCKNCKSDRILTINAKCSDLCYITYKDVGSDGYVPSGIRIGGGDYVDMSICMECGTVQGKFPVDDKKIFKALKEC
jgi:hypothetical protein